MSMQPQTTQEQPYEFTTRKQIAYGFGDFGYNFSWTLVSSFLMYFWTDCFGISDSFAGTIMLLSRFWDAINDPLVGGWADNTRHKSGRYRPWLKWCAVPLMVVNVLCFTAFPFQSQIAKNIYALVSFFIAVLISTMYYIPNTSLLSAVTLDGEKRSKAASYRLCWAYIAAIIITIATRPLVAALGGGNNAKGYILTAIIYSLICGVSIFVVYSNTREVVQVSQEKISYRESMKTLGRNRYVWILAAGFICYGLFNYGRGAVAVYYFTYAAESASAFTIYAILHYGMSFVGALAMPFFAKRAKNKGSVPKYAYLIAGVVLISQTFIDPATSMPAFLIMQVFASFCAGMAASMLYGMIPDVIDYTQFVHGVRASGFVTAFVNFFMKLGMGVGAGSVGWVLAAAGYVANQAQTAATILSIRGLFCALPGAFCIMAFLFLLFYRLDKKSHAGMMEEMASRDGLVSVEK